MTRISIDISNNKTLAYTDDLGWILIVDDNIFPQAKDHLTPASLSLLEIDLNEISRIISDTIEIEGSVSSDRILPIMDIIQLGLLNPLGYWQIRGLNWLQKQPELVEQLAESLVRLSRVGATQEIRQNAVRLLNRHRSRLTPSRSSSRY